MNHARRAKAALKRVLAPHYHKSDLFELLAAEFARVLERTEREAYRGAIRTAANRIGGWKDLNLSKEKRHLVDMMFDDVLKLEREPREKIHGGS